MYEAVECHEYLELPALTIGVDGDGAGRTVILELEEMGIPVERIHWGLPYRIDERGRYQMTPADKVKSDGIKSPDISDTYCFAFLLDYIPAGDGQKATVERDRFLELARARLGEAS